MLDVLVMNIKIEFPRALCASKFFSAFFFAGLVNGFLKLDFIEWFPIDFHDSPIQTNFLM
jgi:hypothetical protein